MGCVMYMATFRLPNPRNYWTEGIEKITKHFTVNRFEQLRSSIHFNSEASSKGSLEKSGKKFNHSLSLSMQGYHYSQ